MSGSRFSTSIIASAKPVSTVARRIYGHFEDYFRFISDPNIGPTNHLAEQAIRFVAIHRRMTQGARGRNGQSWFERICTVVVILSLERARKTGTTSSNSGTHCRARTLCAHQLEIQNRPRRPVHRFALQRRQRRLGRRVVHDLSRRYARPAHVNSHGPRGDESAFQLLPRAAECGA